MADFHDLGNLTDKLVFDFSGNGNGVCSKGIRNSIPVDTIEESVVQILKKYKLLPEDVKSELNVESEKTFTLEEVIKIIDSLPNRNMNISPVFAFGGEVIISKNELIEKLKTL